jgi:hypothetical protein
VVKLNESEVLWNGGEIGFYLSFAAVVDIMPKGHFKSVPEVDRANGGRSSDYVSTLGACMQLHA